MSFKLEIIGNENIEKALKVICEENKENLLKYGFDNYYVKGDELKNGKRKYYFYCITTTLGASLGLRMGGKKLLINEFIKKFKEIDPECEIKEVKLEGK